MKVDSGVLRKGFLYVDTIIRQVGVTTMTSDQLAGKVLYDLQAFFEEEPELELVSLLALGARFVDNPQTVEFLRNEFEYVMTSCHEQVELDLQPYERALFQLFLNKSLDSFQDPIAV